MRTSGADTVAAPVGAELLDDPAAEPAAVRRQLADIARLNRWFGGVDCVVRALEPVFRRATPGAWTLLDIGTGGGDIPRAVARAARRHGISLTAIGFDRIPTAARVARAAGLEAVIGDGDAMPFRRPAADVVLASQVLHHLPRATATRWIAALNALARRAVVIADLRRSRAAMAGVWLAALAMGMPASTRHDAVLSLRRGYKKEELEGLTRLAGVPARVSGRRWARLVAVWEVG
jgi:2-polyprenyl-3-methyl-5-hydroxy-6-metoxy-1,4-benzoquinol methylase